MKYIYDIQTNEWKCLIARFQIIEVYGENEFWPEYRNGVYSWDMAQFNWSPQPVEIGEKGCPLRFEFLGESYIDHHLDEYKGTVSLVVRTFIIHIFLFFFLDKSC